MTRLFSVFVLAAVFGCVPLIASAQSNEVKQSADVTISQDGTASGTWTLPMYAQDPLIEIDNLSDYGATGLMSYQFVKAANDSGPLIAQPYGNGVSVLNASKNGGVSNLYITYNLQSALTSPVAVYEMQVATGGLFSSPQITVHFPAGWQLLTSWPSAQVQGQTATVIYPTGTSYVLPALMVFQPPSLGAGNTIVHAGRFTIIGSAGDVTKLQQAATRLTFMDDLFQKSLGVSPPDNVIVYAADLSQASVGYEAVALAAKPNLILYNKDILKHQSTAVIETTLVHETTHLAEANQELFKGSTYIAPWFKEGLAVFMENQARSYIFSDQKEEAIDDFTGQTHMFSAAELQERESKPFDYLFQGSVGSSVIESYSLAGAVLTNFFNKAGVTGMKQLFAQLKNMDSAQLSDTADSDKIVNTMAGVSGLTSDGILSPFKTSKNFTADAATITHADYGSMGDDAVVNYIKTQVPDYVAGQGASVVSGVMATAATVAPSLATAAPSTTGCPALSRTLSLGSKGNDVTALQQYLIRIGVLNSAPSGYFGKLTQKAVVQWQSANNISAIGSVGPKTRAALAQYCATH